MEQRLLATGLVTKDDFEFVPDTVSKEVLELGRLFVNNSTGSDDIDNDIDNNIDNDKNVSHVKTGIWEIITFNEDDNGGAAIPCEPFYVITGVCMEDKVNTKKLRN
jgi:hypothetical protein